MRETIMPTTRDRLPEALQTILPWIAAGAACLIAFVILSNFIDTLQLSIQRGEALRESLALQETTRSNVTTQLADSRAGQPPAKP